MYNYIIYKLIFPNGKIYIGQTCQNFDSYMNDYSNNSLNKNRKDYNRFINNAIRKYDWNNVKKEILFDNVSKGFVDELETYLIFKYKSANKKFGYNLESGGNKNKHHSKESKEKMRIAKLGKYNGKNNPMFGRKHSEETIEKNRRAHLNKKLSKESIEKRTKKRQKPVDTFIYKTGKFVETFESIKQAGIKLNIFTTHISAVLNGRQKSTGGYNFKYSREII